MRPPPAPPPPGLPPALEKLRHHLGASTRPALEFGRLPTGLAALDEALGGGLIQGGLTEVAGPPGCGATSLATAAAARASRAGHSAAWLDPGLTFDPLSAVRDGADLARILWIHPPGPREAFEAAEVLVESEAFALVVLDLAAFAAGERRRQPLPESLWPRLASRVREHPVVLLVLAPEPLVGPLARTTLVARGGPGRELAEGGGAGADLPRTRRFGFELLRNRGGPVGREVRIELHVAPRKLFP